MIAKELLPNNFPGIACHEKLKDNDEKVDTVTLKDTTRDMSKSLMNVVYKLDRLRNVDTQVVSSLYLRGIVST